jgi:PAS domain S-box-containing protein
MSPAAISDLSLAFGMGMAATLALLHLGFYRRADPVHAWVALWCATTGAYLGFRFVQVGTAEPAAALTAARGLASTAPLLALSAVGMARALADKPFGWRAWSKAGALAMVMGLLIFLSPWFVEGQVSSRLDWFGREHLAVSTGPAMGLLLPMAILAFGYSASLVMRSPALNVVDRQIFLGSLTAYALIAVLSILSAMRVIDAPPTTEFAPLVFGVGLNTLLVSRHRRLQHNLESSVQARTREMRATHDQLVESEERYRRLFENAPIGVIALDREGSVVAANYQLVAMIGAPSLDGLVGQDLIGNERLHASGIAGIFERCISRGEPQVGEHHHTFRWGRTTDLRIIATPVRDAAGHVQGALGIVEDLSERKAWRNVSARARSSKRWASSPPASPTRSTTPWPTCAATSRCCGENGRPSARGSAETMLRRAP